jgi:hypothetical protein
MAMTVQSEEANPARRFPDRATAQAEADRITRTPRRGLARVQYTGAWDCWLVEVNLRSAPYGNPGVLRTDGTVAKYH